MEQWVKIVNLAMLGTEKAKLEEKYFDVHTSEVFEQITQRTDNKEDQFLQSATMLSNYRRCGFIPLRAENGLMSASPEEEKSYANAVAHATLADVLSTSNTPLLQFWLMHCVQANQLIRPEILPEILSLGSNAKQLRTLIGACMGARGKWLVQWNEAWQWSAHISQDDAWENGSLAERKVALTMTREQDPARGLSLLVEAWPRENAATRAELLECLKTGVGEEVLPWLEQLMQEKSVKVRDAAMSLLKTIPQSTLLQRYWTFLKASINIEQGKGLLGFGTKYTLTIHPPPHDPANPIPGIDPLSGNKGISDELYIVSQCISHIPPHFWTEHYLKDITVFLEFFRKNDKYRLLLPAFGHAAVTFRNDEWLRTIIQMDESTFYPEAVFALPQREVEKYFMGFLQHDGEAPRIFQMLEHLKEEWSVNFTRELFKYTARNPYQFHKGFYTEHAASIPVAAIAELEKCTPKEEHHRQSWIKNTESIERLLSLKARTVQAFIHS
jgi:hypothetical protein